MSDELIQCPSCKGTGVAFGMFPVYAPHVPQSERKPFIEVKCFRCHGAKSVPSIHLQWIEQGKAIRQQRIDSKITLREFCQTNNVSPVDRSLMECGEVDPINFVPRTWNPAK